MILLFLGKNYPNKRRFGWLPVITTWFQRLAELFWQSDGRLEVDVIFPNIAGSLWELLDQEVESSKAVLLNMFQPDLDVLHRLTFADNHSVNSWLEYVLLFYFYFYFFQTESTQLYLWWMPNGSARAKRQIIRAENSQALRPADNTVQAVSHTAEWTKCRLYYFDCLLDIWFDFILTYFSHTRLGQKLNVLQYCSFPTSGVRRQRWLL